MEPSRRAVATVREGTAGSARPDSGGGRGGQTNQLRSEYNLGPVLGQGAFGVVYACSKINSKELKYAVKMVDKVETPVKEIEEEADMLAFLEHPNIVKFRALYYERFFVCIVMDRYMGGDLIEGMQAYWKAYGQIPCTRIIHVSRQMCDAIKHMHFKSVVHRDIKGDNYLMDRGDLIDKDCRIILSDFGTAKQLRPDERLNAVVGTKIYWAPEFFDLNYGLKVDVWALGVIMYGLLVGRFPFKGEHDSRHKMLNLPKGTPPPCREYILGLLTRHEKERLSAEQAYAHKWLSYDGEKEIEIDAGFKPEAMDEIEWLNAGIAERRQELVARMKKPNRKSDFSALSNMRLQTFDVESRAAKRILVYEWWTREKVESLGVIRLRHARPEGKTIPSAHSHQVVAEMLCEHGIDVERFGKDRWKKLEEFVAEVQNGSALLLLDATQHKKLVRVVDTVLVRIAHQPRRQPDKTSTFLIEFQQRFSDGRVVSSSRLPGTKKEPHENTKTCSLRIVRDILGLSSEVTIDFDIQNREVFEEEAESPSYPDVRTVYRKEIVEGVVSTTETATPMLDAMGIRNNTSDGNAFSHKEIARGNTRSFCWMTEADCVRRQIKLRVPAEAEDISALVHAPIGYNLNELTKFLERNGVDPDKFGQHGARTLKEFSTELVKGEANVIVRPRQVPSAPVCDRGYYRMLGVSPDASLSEIETAYDRLRCRSPGGGESSFRLISRAFDTLSDPDRRKAYDFWGARGPNQVIRVVDVVCLFLLKGDQILVHTEERACGEATGRQMKMLPGAKKRPDENQFLTAQRILKRQLRVDENWVNMDPDNVMVLEEEKASERSSPLYPGLHTLYRKRVITARLVLPDQ